MTWPFGWMASFSMKPKRSMACAICEICRFRMPARVVRIWRQLAVQRD
jgi:hypothetical protein